MIQSGCMEDEIMLAIVNVSSGWSSEVSIGSYRVAVYASRFPF